MSSFGIPKASSADLQASQAQAAKTFSALSPVFTKDKTTIAIVGEGPVGLLTTILFLQYIKNENIQDIHLTLFRSRPTFTRRHVIKVTDEIIREIEIALGCRDRCILKEKDVDERLTFNINCLEHLLYQQFKTETNELFSIVERSFSSETKDKFNQKFDHIILCDSYHSSNRAFYVQESNAKDDKNKPKSLISPLIYRSIKPIISLYFQLPDFESHVADDCGTKETHKIDYANPEDFKIIKFDETTNEAEEVILSEVELSSIVSLVYNIYDRWPELSLESRINSFIVGNTELEAVMPRKKVNYWTQGFSNFNDFLHVWDNAEKIITQLRNVTSVDSGFGNVLFEILNKQYGVFVTPEMVTYLNHEPTYKEAVKNLELFIQQQLSNNRALDAPFMFHSLRPNATMHGVIFDNPLSSDPDYYNNYLAYAREYEINKYAWILGDSANSYPPGNSLLIGLKDSFWFSYNFFLKYQSIREKAVPRSLGGERAQHTSYINFCSFDGEKYKFARDMFTQLDCNFIDKAVFYGGYGSDDPRNGAKSLDDVLTLIEEKSKLDEENPGSYNNLINNYSRYQINNFFSNLVQILCQTPANSSYEKYIDKWTPNPLPSRTTAGGKYERKTRKFYKKSRNVKHRRRISTYRRRKNKTHKRRNR
jgi:hypothetical protein